MYIERRTNRTLCTPYHVRRILWNEKMISNIWWRKSNLLQIIDPLSSTLAIRWLLPKSRKVFFPSLYFIFPDTPITNSYDVGTPFDLEVAWPRRGYLPWCTFPIPVDTVYSIITVYLTYRIRYIVYGKLYPRACCSVRLYTKLYVRSDIESFEICKPYIYIYTTYSITTFANDIHCTMYIVHYTVHTVLRRTMYRV